MSGAMSESWIILLVGVALVAPLIMVAVWVWYPLPPAQRDDQRDDRRWDRPDSAWERWCRQRNGIDRGGMDGGGLAARVKDGGGGR